ncbi:hypothetical protein DSL72_000852 [Monilinia vaccinii-corymbosi]|uniref:Uncharacterized protein n=1 Tax=Monilinia vaccinii-corymbosi TaxID=61207 RepID=A0A8A3P9S9_9HELO|nr:hypothetical protein DSL72_000852 [Monilinia vaccinii-corymbosi]
MHIYKGESCKDQRRNAESDEISGQSMFWEANKAIAEKRQLPIHVDMKTLDNQSINSSSTAPHLANMGTENHDAKSPAKAAHVNMIAGCIIAIAPAEGLRSMLGVSWERMLRLQQVSQISYKNPAIAYTGIVYNTEPIT